MRSGLRSQVGKPRRPWMDQGDEPELLASRQGSELQAMQPSVERSAKPTRLLSVGAA
jgi:hypothetical protein